jgi:hypothetical protein
VSCTCQSKGTSDHHAGQPAQHEDEEEAEHVEHRHGEAGPALPQVAIQAKTCMPFGIATAKLAAAKNVSDRQRYAHGVHVMHPQPEADEARGDRRQHHPLVADEWARANTGISIESMPAAGRKMM